MKFNVKTLPLSFLSSFLYLKVNYINFLFSIFTKSEIEEIRRTTLWDVITNATNIPPDAIQRQVFVWQNGDPCPQPFQLNSTMLEPCVPLQRYDYFEVTN